MAHVYTEESNFENIANAIREKNGKSDTYAPSEMADAIRDIEPNLEEKRITIDNNGETIIVPTEEYEGLSKVVVNSRVVGDGYDFTTIGYTPEKAEEINDDFITQIKSAQEVYDRIKKNPTISLNYYFVKSKIKWLPFIEDCQITGLTYTFQSCNSLRFYDHNFDSPNINSLDNTFSDCYALEYVYISAPNATSAYRLAYVCSNLKYVEFLDSDNITTFTEAFVACYSLLSAKFGSIKNCTSNITITTNTSNLHTFFCREWKKANISILSLSLSADSIKYIIWHAMNGANTLGYEDEGATSRTLTLQKATIHNVTWAGCLISILKKRK